jgi:hypothetical protein
MSSEALSMLKRNNRPFYGRKRVDAGVVWANVKEGEV